MCKKRHVLAMLFVLTSAISFAQNAEGTSLATTPEFSNPRLTRAFVVSGLEAANALRDWQRHLELTVRNGYPPSEFWIGEDETRAANALRLAAVVASNEADYSALHELKDAYEAVRQWSSSMLQGYQDMRLANYYMSSSAFANDAHYQRASACTEGVINMLGYGYRKDVPSCH